MRLKQVPSVVCGLRLIIRKRLIELEALKYITDRAWLRDHHGAIGAGRFCRLA